MASSASSSALLRLTVAAARRAAASSASATSSRLLSGSCASTSFSLTTSSTTPSTFSIHSTSFLSASGSLLGRSFSAAANAENAELASEDEIAVELDDPSLPAPAFMVGPGRAPVLELDLDAAIAAVKSKASSRFDESVDAAFVLGIDPRRGDHSVRGAATLPAGTGKEAKVAFFAEDGSAEAEAARAAGALVAGGDSLISLIAEKGSAAIEFDRALAAANVMPKLAKIARVLGPRGLMPNPKLGTVVGVGGGGGASAAPSPAAVAAAVAAASAGRVSFRADKGGVVHAPVGRASFEEGALRQNVGALADALLSARPKALKGGGWSGYVKRVALSTTHGKGGVRVSLQSVVAAAAQAKAAAKK